MPRRLPIELQRRKLLDLGQRLCEEQGLDPVIAIEALDVLDPELTYQENKRRYLEELEMRGVRVEETEKKVSKWEEELMEQEAEKYRAEELEMELEEAKEKLKIAGMEGMTKEEADRLFKVLAGERAWAQYRDVWEKLWEEGLKYADGREVQERIIGAIAELLYRKEEVEKDEEVRSVVKLIESKQDFFRRWFELIGR